MHRRHFLQGSSAAYLGALTLGHRFAARALGLAPAQEPQGNAAGEEELRIALVGCGGRGTGAARQALSTDGPVRLVAMADAFADRLESSHQHLAEGLPPGRVDVPPERRHVGFDAYRKAVDEDVDVVVMATPPGFRPIHFAYCVERGRHVFMEKPVAVDGPGVRKVLEAAQEAKRKRLRVGVGLQRHHQARYLATIERIHAGAIGRPVLLRAYWNSAGVWVRERQPQMTEMEYQMRNWYYFNWLCGDHVVEQHIHNLDVANWVMQGTPVRAQGQGGREVRDGPDHGEIFDHHMVEYTYEDGTRLLSQSRHIPGCWNSVSEHVHGSEGSGNVGAGRLERVDGDAWRFSGEDNDPYQQEHDDLFAAIRAGAPYNEAELGAMSTMTAILGRMATYSGQELTMQQGLESELALVPEEYAWDARPPTVPGDDGRYPVPVPGRTRAF